MRKRERVYINHPNSERMRANQNNVFFVLKKKYIKILAPKYCYEKDRALLPPCLGIELS
jgi:hypothetical protein